MRKILLTSFSILILTFPVIGQYTLQGDTFTLWNECYQLTNDVSGQAGAVWRNEPINLNEPFNLQIKVNFGSNDAGGEGIVFVMQTAGTSVIGNSGSGMGFSGISQSLGIEFDTFWDEADGDLQADHIGIITDGGVGHTSPTAIAGPVTATSSEINIEDGLDHVIEVNWDPETQEVNIFFDCEFRLVASIDLINNVFNGNSTVWWGFTSSTSDVSNLQSVCLYDNAQPIDDITVCPGLPAALNTLGDLDAPFLWTPSDSLSDPNIHNPFATPSFTTLYTVTYFDLCGVMNMDSVLVTVDPLTVGITPNHTYISCVNEVITLNTSSNFGANIDYLWETVPDGSFLSIDGNASIVDDLGHYAVTASIGNICYAYDTVFIDLDTTYFPASAGPDGYVDCYIPSYTLFGSSDSTNAAFSWSSIEGDFSSSTNISAPISIAGGSYILTVTNPISGCKTTDIAYVEEDFIAPDISLGYPTDILSCNLLQVQIINTDISPAAYSSTIEWTTADGELIDPYVLEPTASYAGDYTLTVTFEENGCSTTSENAVIVNQVENAFLDISSLTMPNVITPNGDNYNDHLKPLLSDYPNVDPLSLLDLYDLSIFNKWGTVVYRNNGLPFAWDGKSNGAAISSGTYVVLVKYNRNCRDLQSGSYTGPLEIIRNN